MIERPSSEETSGVVPARSAAQPPKPLLKLRTVKILLAVIFCALIAVAFFAVNVISHDPRSAAATAKHFADRAFVRNDIESSLDDLAPEMRKAFASSELTAVVVEMHPKSRPSEVTASEYEPLFGQKAMLIYLKGTGEAEEFHYRFLMVGTTKSGYKISGIWRGSGPYPPTARRPL